MGKMTIKLSQITLEEITTRGRTTITEDKGNPKEIYLVLDVTHVMRRDITPKIVPKTKAPPTRGPTRKDILLTLLKMMNQQRKESKKKELILQVMKNMS